MQPFTYPANAEKAKLIRKKTTTTVFLGHEAVVNTYTVHPTDKAGNILNRGPDDNTYKDSELADLVPRGCSDLFIDDKLVAQVRGARKFFGTNDIIDEDEPPFEGADEKDIEAFAKSHESDAATIATWNDANILRVDFWEKANGKFVICTLFELDGDLYIFGGSKNVHMPLPLNSRDIPGPRDLHHIMLNMVISDVIRCENPRFLIGKQIMGEYCDGKHIVYANTPYMVYFDESLPGQFRKPMKILPSVNNIPSSDILTSLRSLIELEGVVLYYTNTITGQFIRIKHKTVWYVIIRSWREIIGRHKKGNTQPSKIIGLLKSRAQTRSDQFLHLTPEELAKWKDLADTFVTRLTESKYAYNDVNPMSDVGMAKIWYELMIEQHDAKQADVNAADVGPAEIKSEHPTSTPTPTNTPAPETFESIPIEQILIQPVYYYAVSYAAFVSNVLVIMQGPPGSGKSTVVSQLKKNLRSMQITAESFSTDDYFMKDGIYHFDPKQLGVYHAKNLEASSASNAQVVIIDNTNLTPGEYARYKSAMLDRIVIVLSCNVESPETLMRNKHGVPIDSLKKMCAKYSPTAPAYIGGFVSKNHLLPWKDEIKQIQPLHLTELFVGGNNKKLANYDFSTLMQSYTFTVTGISRSPAGVGLVCTADIRCESTPHITLAVNEGAKTVDVGKQIAPENTTKFDSPHVLFAIRLPMF